MSILRAIVNVGHSFWYPNGQQRLADSLDTVGEFTADRLFWRDEWPPWSPPHSEIPYAFKLYALLAARDAGYGQALWVDSSCWAVRPLAPIWEQLDRDGYYLEADGHRLGEWISDTALEQLGETRDGVWDWPLPEGKLMGFDFRDENANGLLADVLDHVDLFAGPWTNDGCAASTDERCRGHRHDISITGTLAPRHLPWDGAGPKRVAFPVEGIDPSGDAILMSQGIGTW